jgi:hypothetical protein
MKAGNGYSGDDFVREAVYKAKGGVIRVALDAGVVINKIKITGDFFLFPEESIERLEDALVGSGTSEGELLKIINNFYENIDSYGILPGDIVKAIKRAL